MATKRNRSHKQGHLDGMAPPSISSIDKAADHFVDVRDERMALQVTEAERKAVLMDLMKKNELTYYEYDGKEVVLDTEPGLSVRKKKAEKKPKAEGDEPEGDEK